MGSGVYSSGMTNMQPLSGPTALLVLSTWRHTRIAILHCYSSEGSLTAFQNACCLVSSSGVDASSSILSVRLQCKAG